MLSEEEFLQLQTYLEKKLTFDANNISTKLMEYAAVHQSLLKLLATLHAAKKTTEDKQRESYGNLYKFYKFESEYRWDSKTEVESQIFADKKYVAICASLNTIEVQLIYVGKSLDSIKDLSFAIKNYIDWQKLMNGA